MAEKAVNRRKSQMFLTNISPVTNTFDELVKEKLVCGKFPLTAAGILKMVSLVFLLGGEMIFIVNPTCSGNSDWYPYLFPTGIGTTVALELLLFLIFSFGLTVHNPGLWIKMDIVTGFLSSFETIICSTLSLRDCAPFVTNKVSGCLGISGAVILIISSVAMVLMYRYIEDPNEVVEPTPLPFGTDTRKSIFA